MVQCDAQDAPSLENDVHGQQQHGRPLPLRWISVLQQVHQQALKSVVGYPHDAGSPLCCYQA